MAETCYRTTASEARAPNCGEMIFALGELIAGMRLLSPRAEIFEGFTVGA